MKHWWNIWFFPIFTLTVTLVCMGSTNVHNLLLASKLLLTTNYNNKINSATNASWSIPCSKHFLRNPASPLVNISKEIIFGIPVHISVEIFLDLVKYDWEIKFIWGWCHILTPGHSNYIVSNKNVTLIYSVLNCDGTILTRYVYILSMKSQYAEWPSKNGKVSFSLLQVNILRILLQSFWYVM